MKNGSSIALSVIGTIAVAGYICYTEFPFWERWTKKEASSSSQKPRLIKRKKKPKSKKPRKQAEDKKNAEAQPEPVKTYRSGDTGLYLVDKTCDCQYGNAFVLDSVELTPSQTIINLINAQRREISTYPKGSKYAQYLLEARYVKGDRPRLDLLDMRGIPLFPATARSLEFQFVFPRISDEAPKFQFTGKASTKLDYFSFVTVDLDRKLTPEQADNHRAYHRCGFNAVPQLAQGQKKLFSAHKRPGARGFSWSVSDEMEIVGSSSKDTVQVRGVSTGKGEVCLNARFDGAACRYCQGTSVKPESDAVNADFKMIRCGGQPSKEPHWQFSVTEPTRGATYFWKIEPGVVRRGSARKKTLIASPNFRPGRFKITLTATSKSGAKSTTSREYHNVFSCVKEP